MKADRRWAGRILTAIAALFLLFDGITKVLKMPQVVEATAQLGFSESSIASRDDRVRAVVLPPISLRRVNHRQQNVTLSVA